MKIIVPCQINDPDEDVVMGALRDMRATGGPAQPSRFLRGDIVRVPDAAPIKYVHGLAIVMEEGVLGDIIDVVGFNVETGEQDPIGIEADTLEIVEAGPYHQSRIAPSGGPPWNDWNGGFELPVADDVVVQVLRRDGFPRRVPAGDLNWHHVVGHERPTDIVKWRQIA